MILFFSFLSIASAVEIWTIPTMNCQGCEEKIQEIIEISSLSLSPEKVDYASRMLCFSTPLPEEEARKLEDLLQKNKYIVSEKKQQASCIQEKRNPWEDTRGDFQIISHGERVSLKKHISKGKYTLIDFSAIWCGPCYDISSQLKPLLESHPELAVRVIELPADQKIAFEAPVVFQHLSQAEGLPYLILFDNKGKKRYEGNNIEEALQYIPFLSEQQP